MHVSMPGRPKPSVFIVDDDDFSQEILREMLAVEGILDIQTASNGRKALRMLADAPQTPDVLICDIFMPDMDGFQVLDELAKLKYKGGIIMVTSVSIELLATAQTIAMANGLQVLGAFTKPVPPDVLMQTIASHAI